MMTRIGEILGKDTSGGIRSSGTGQPAMDPDKANDSHIVGHDIDWEGHWERCAFYMPLQWFNMVVTRKT
ncbi:hypothetical protein JTE90_019939 [Oedothorax gibbosus]|uniref:Uncharacterized protein n=1 Tax=Oedothorax gibbosus TaxID=931172 RepID=A0AAV6US08_9ARAC|nr:hypothetical protein JTE90_019939 [Oedothorax gibbosus]